VLVRVGVSVTVGELDAVGLGVEVLSGAGFGFRLGIEQASVRKTVENRNKSFRIETSQVKVVIIILPVSPPSNRLSNPEGFEQTIEQD
jgi:hypothetical protein